MSAQETGPSGTPAASDESTFNDSSDDEPVERSLIPTDDDSQNIAIFWGWNDRAFFSSLISTPLLAGIWYGWIWWILHRHPSGSTIWWTVYVGFIVVVLSFCAGRRIIVFIASVVAAPFVVVRSCYVFFLARYFVVSTNWFRRHPSGPQNCKLCSKCDRLVSNSSLLVGAPWVLVRPSEIHHFYFLPDLQVSSETCHLCSLFWHSLKSIDQSSITHPTQPLAAAKKAQKPSDISLSEGMRIGPKEMSTSPSLPKAIYKLQPIQKVERQGDTYLRVKIWKQSHCLRKSVLRMQICGDPISTSEVLKVENARASDDPVRHKCYQSQRTDSKDIIAWAKVLIDQCSEGHELCKARFVADESRSYLPLRLLDVGGSQGDPIKLIDGAELKAELVTYLALSHCWGGPIDAKLYKGNLEDMKTTGVKTLPCNFREAIIVTRGLGERYLWIDSLCIVQDDGQEWEEQSINMGLVYANAKCVLSATASENSNGGCFRPRDLFRSDCVLRRRWNRALIVRSQERSDLVRLFKRKIEGAPLTKRGWTFQERYLASRILHFGSGVVLFECNKLIASDHDQGKIGQEYSVRQVIRSDGKLHAAEDIGWARRDIRKTKVVRKTVKVRTGRNSYKSEMRDVTVMNPDYPYQQATKARLRNDSARLGMRGTFDFLWRYNGTNFAEQIEFHNSWYEMIEHYSSRNLSHSGDKLMAISGVAYFIQQNTNLKYNSGLWEGTIKLSMLWTVSGKPKTRPTRPVPTWSWASVDGRVSHRLKEAMPASANEFHSSWQTFESHLSTYSVSATTSETINGLVLNSELHLTGNLWSLRPGMVKNVTWDVLSVSQRDLFVLPILSFVNERVHPMGSKLQLHGIVLRLKSGCIYERVGYFWTADAKAIEQFSGKSPQASQRQTIVLV